MFGPGEYLQTRRRVLSTSKDLQHLNMCVHGTRIHALPRCAHLSRATPLGSVRCTTWATSTRSPGDLLVNTPLTLCTMPEAFHNMI